MLREMYVKQIFLQLILVSFYCHTSARCAFDEKILNESYCDADVAMIATAKQILVNPYNASWKMGIVEVKRILKGENLVTNAGRIAIYGLRNRNICRSTLRIRETKIIFLKRENGLLQLSSSLFPITLRMLDWIGSLTQGRHHKRRRRIRHLQCETIRCPYGSKCVLQSGKCECKTLCKGSGPVICGTDNVSYASECHLAVKSCLSVQRGGEKIRKKEIGQCDRKDPCADLRCGPGAQCIISENENGFISAHCVCQQECFDFGDSVESSLICSVDGIDFPSLCHLRAHACKHQLNTSIKYFGKCDPCENYTCPFGTVCKISENRQPICRCSQQCNLQSDPVCASDGNTYENECLMSVSACRMDKQIEVFRKGRCSDHPVNENPCATMGCGSDQTCHISQNGKASCKCFEYCPPIMKPVCAVDGKTYDNECEMRSIACLERVHLVIRHTGICGKGMCAGYEGCIPPKVCVVRDGRQYCECETCDSTLSEVCGSDGITYPNACKMRLESCITGKLIYQKYSGICEGCDGMDCEFYQVCVSDKRALGSCRCLNHCSHNDYSSKVCGTDGLTYESECQMRLAACQQKKFIVVAFRGDCEKCHNVFCAHGQRCQDGVCSCPSNCLSPTKRDEICGSDGFLYPSECYLQMVACKTSAQIEVVPLNRCTRGFFEDACKCNEVGAYERSCTPSQECRCRPGVGGRRCDKCISEFWGIHLIAKKAIGCQPCGCSLYGSTRLDCEQMTGRCQCKKDSFGLKCNKCKSGYRMTPRGCQPEEGITKPKSCREMNCYHGAICVINKFGKPDCLCPPHCVLDNVDILANITVCGSNGETYSSICNLSEFACKQQLDTVPMSLGICPQNV